MAGLVDTLSDATSGNWRCWDGRVGVRPAGGLVQLLEFRQSLGQLLVGTGAGLVRVVFVPYRIDRDTPGDRVALASRRA